MSTLPSLGRPERETKSPAEVFFSPGVIGGVPWAVASKFVLFSVYFGVSIITVRSLGVDKYGTVSLCKNMAEYLAVVCSLGLNTALIRFIPELLVGQNRTGLCNLLWKAGALQATMVAGAALALWATKPYLDGWFNVDFQYHLLLLITLLVGAGLSRDFISDAFTALFQVRITSIISICRGVLWFGLAAVALPILPEVRVALLTQIVPFIAVSIVGGILLTGFVRRLNWRSSSFGIEKRRTIGISLSSMVDSMANMLLMKYAEIFFLGVFFTPAVVGMYDLGCSIPFMVITFIPIAVQKLFTSGFAEAYTRDKNCLGKLILSFYKALILAVVPLSVFGAFFAPRAIELFYGGEMQAAGPMAALFFIVHALPLVYMPLTMAIVTREKILRMLPLTILQIVVNLLLDYLLIPRYGMEGAAAAVLGAHVISAPFILYAASRIVGGIYFPFKFFVKITVPLTVLAAILSPLSPYLNVAELFGLGIGYVGAYLVMVRGFRLVWPGDVEELRNLGFDKLNKVLDRFVGSPRS